MIPDDKQWYNEQMMYYTYQMHVKYPEIYFILAIQGMNKENLPQFMEKHANLDKLNLVEVTKIENQLHECTQEDVNAGMPQIALGKPMYSFKMFDA